MRGIFAAKSRPFFPQASRMHTLEIGKQREKERVENLSPSRYLARYLLLPIDMTPCNLTRPDGMMNQFRALTPDNL